jgi:hypothetical protein
MFGRMNRIVSQIASNGSFLSRVRRWRWPIGAPCPGDAGLYRAEESGHDHIVVAA